MNWRDVNLIMTMQVILLRDKHCRCQFNFKINKTKNINYVNNSNTLLYSWIMFIFTLLYNYEQDLRLVYISQ